MFDISAALRLYDRKERGWLIRNALEPTNLSSEFLNALSEKLGLVNPIPKNAWWALDYHLDWLFASLHAFATGHLANNVSVAVDNSDEKLRHTIEDIDLIIADASRVFLIEAKAFGPWKREQLNRKVKRLGKFINGGKAPGLNGRDVVQVFFVLTSLDDPPNASKCESWPEWLLREGAPIWIKLHTTHQDFLHKTVRCDAKGVYSGKARGELTHWTVQKERLNPVKS